MNFKDRLNKKYGRLTVIEHVGHGSWLCRCECGKKKIVDGSNLGRGNTKSCGCLQKDITSKCNSKPSTRLKDRKGQRFGRLVVVSYSGKGKWLCMCDCGTECCIDIHSLRSNNTLSCGCLARENSSKRAIERNKISFKSISKAEMLLGDFIENEYEIKLDRHYQIKNRIFDMRYKNVLIESDGRYWHSLAKSRHADKIKNELAKEHGFVILRFSLNDVLEVKRNWKTTIKPVLDRYFYTA